MWTLRPPEPDGQQVLRALRTAAESRFVSRGLEAKALSRSFGRTVAVDRVSFGIAPGQVLTLFGPNGAGKTTLLRVLAGALRPQSGEVRLGGEPLDPTDVAWRARVGLLSHRSFVYGRLTAAENLAFFGALYGLQDLDRRVPERLASVGLEAQSDTEARHLSRGMTQRLALARSLIHDPDVVLLDEPYTGLDAQAAARLLETLEALRDGRRSVLLVTHSLTQGLRLADQVGVLSGGRLVYLADDFERDPARFETMYRTLADAAA